MSGIDDIRKFAKEAFDTIADVSVEAYKMAEDKAKIVARKTKLNTEITLEKSQIRRLHSEIGVIYYEKHKDDPSESLKQHCEDITSALERIASKQKEIETLKKSANLTDEDIDEVNCEKDDDES